MARLARLPEDAERSAPSWGLYVAALYTISLVLFVTSLLAMAASFIGAGNPDWRSPLSVGLVWALVWWWHRWMWRHPARGALVLATVPAVIGTYFGLGLGVEAAVTALGGLLDVAIRGSMDLTSTADPWWQSTLQDLIWAAGERWSGGGTGSGAARAGCGAGSPTSGLIVVGVLAAGLLALGGAGTVLFVLLRWYLTGKVPCWSCSPPWGRLIAAAAVGSLVWRYYRTAAAGRAERTRQAGVLVTSGVWPWRPASHRRRVILNAALSIAVSPWTRQCPDLLLGRYQFPRRGRLRLVAGMETGAVGTGRPTR